MPRLGWPWACPRPNGLAKPRAGGGVTTHPAARHRTPPDPTHPTPICWPLDELNPPAPTRIAPAAQTATTPPLFELLMNVSRPGAPAIGSGSSAPGYKKSGMNFCWRKIAPAEPARRRTTPAPLAPAAARRFLSAALSALSLVCITLQTCQGSISAEHPCPSPLRRCAAAPGVNTRELQRSRAEQQFGVIAALLRTALLRRCAAENRPAEQIIKFPCAAPYYTTKRPPRVLRPILIGNPNQDALLNGEGAPSQSFRAISNDER